MGLGVVISNILTLGATLLHVVQDSPSSSSLSSGGSVDDIKKIETELGALMRMLKRIKATLYDAEQRYIKDKSVELWLRELKEVADDAENVLDDYHYEVLRAQVEAKDVCPPDSRISTKIQVPDGMFDQIQLISNKFAEIGKDRIALQLSKADGSKRFNCELQIAPTSHLVDESGVFGRENEKKKLIDLLLSAPNDGKVVSVVAIVGTGGLGKTTLAQLACSDQRIKQGFDIFSWICVSDNFDVQRLTKELMESFGGSAHGITNLAVLQENVCEMIREKRVLLILDDVWNEKKSLWETFQAPFKSALFVKILVTTRNKPVARIMQTIPTFELDYLLEEDSWQLFKHYAFGGLNLSVGSNFIEIGKKIMKKCAMLPLALKAIASLLRHELDEESWQEILESELWETDASDDIFPPLQLSYVRLPTYLKHCLIFCSMFPKGYVHNIENLAHLWISHCYIESKGKKTFAEIGLEYGKQLWHRSLFESKTEWNNSKSRFKLHDMVHDLVQLNSKNKFTVLSKDQHLYVKGLHGVLLEPIPFNKLTTLRTLIIKGVKNCFDAFDLSVLQKLRALEIDKCLNHKLGSFSSIGNLKHLRYLSIRYFSFERLPECVCSLHKLKILILCNCSLLGLPTNIGNLISLEKLVISNTGLKKLPESFCHLKALRECVFSFCSALEGLPNSNTGCLKNLQTLEIHNSSVSYLPYSFRKVQTLAGWLICKKIGWLKNFVHLDGNLTFLKLENVSNLIDVQCANLANMHNLKRLWLCWGHGHFGPPGGKQFILRIERGQTSSVDNQKDYAVLACLMPHPNLRELMIDGYRGSTFPEWIGNPSFCASLGKISIISCNNLTFLPFAMLHKLKYVMICSCHSLWMVSSESLPLTLEKLYIKQCEELKSVCGLQKLNSLVELSILDCPNLQKLGMDAQHSVQLMLHRYYPSYQNPLLGLRSLNSLRMLEIGRCPKLQLKEHVLFCAEACQVQVWGCPLLRKWCLQHGINYKDEPMKGHSYNLLAKGEITSGLRKLLLNAKAIIDGWCGE